MSSRFVLVIEKSYNEREEQYRSPLHVKMQNAECKIGREPYIRLLAIQ
jgi:hypothetical protein